MTEVTKDMHKTIQPVCEISASSSFLSSGLADGLAGVYPGYTLDMSPNLHRAHTHCSLSHRTGWTRIQTGKTLAVPLYEITEVNKKNSTQKPRRCYVVNFSMFISPRHEGLHVWLEISTIIPVFFPVVVLMIWLLMFSTDRMEMSFR